MKYVPHENKSRKQIYHELRKAGYTSREANRLKDHSLAKVIKLIKIKDKHRQELEAVIND